MSNSAAVAVIKAAVYREGGSAFDYSALTVEARGDDRWAVKRDGCECLSVSGKWDYEPLPSSRTDEWMAAHRFDYEEAVARAVAMVEADENYLARERLTAH